MSGKSGWPSREKRGGKLTNAMIYTVIDYHKRYSVACTLDAQGHQLHGKAKKRHVLTFD